MGASSRRERRDNTRRVMAEAGFSPAERRAALAVSRSARALAIAGLVVVFVGFFVIRFVGFAVVLIGLALFGGAVVLGIAMIPWRRRIDKVRWQDGTVTIRTFEPGHVGESGQHVVCEVQLNPTARIVYEPAVNQTPRIARVSTTVGPLDSGRLMVGATMRCLIDRLDTRIVLRAFPYARPSDPLPSGRELKFRKA